MKTLNITFEDEEFEYMNNLKEQSNTESWRAFLLEALNYEVEK
jgi:hypothetical protein